MGGTNWQGLGEKQYMGTDTGPVGACINQATSGKTASGSFRVRCGLAAASVCPHEGERISKKDSKQLRGRTLKIHKWGERLPGNCGGKDRTRTRKVILVLQLHDRGSEAEGTFER